MKNLKTLVAVVFCFALLVQGIPASAAPSIKILVPTAMTGGLSGVEQFCREGAEMAAEEINAAGGVKGRPLQLVLEDCTSTVPGAVNALNKLLSSNSDAVAIYGVLMSHFALAWDPIVRKAQLPFLTGGSNIKITAQGNPWIFRIRPNDGIQTELLAKYIVEKLKANKIGIFYDTNEYGKGGMENVSAALNKLGVKPVIVEAHNTGDKDFTPQFLKFRNAKIDILIAWNHPLEAALTVRHWQQIGRPFKLVGCPSYPPSDPTWSMVKEAAEGVQALIDAVVTEGSSASVKDLALKYKNRYKKEFNFAAINGYDAIKILSQAIEKGGAEPDKIRETLHKGVYKGLMTSYQFDAKGDGVWEVSITEIKNGKINEIERIHFK